MSRKLDWQSRHDERSRDYGIRAILQEAVVPVKKMWDEGVVLDQGNEGACVGFGWMGEVLAQPVIPQPKMLKSPAEAYAINIYNTAKQIDEIPGENYTGTSVLAGAKVMMARGFITAYRWCFNITDIRDAIIKEGPVVIGIPWKDGMYSTDTNGLVSVSGKLVGGHCLVLTGYDPAMQIGARKYEVFRWRNSWGFDYGVSGSGYIKATDLAKLLKTVGEACVPIGRKIPAKFVTNVPAKQSFLKTLGEKLLTWTKR